MHHPGPARRPEDKILTEAIDDNLTAAAEAARSVRMGLKTGTAAVLQTDLDRVRKHLGEVEALLRPFFDPKVLKQFKVHAASVKKVATEVHALVKESADKPAVAQQAKSSSEILAKIKPKVGLK